MQMNRIERLIWEETQLKGIERLQRESHGTTGAKLILIAILVGFIALLASRVSIPPLDDAVVRALVPTSVFYTPIAAPNPASDVGTSAATSSRDTVDEVERAAPQDDPPIAAFGHQPRFRGHEPFVAPSSSVQASHGEKHM
jgi:hypothetical protein